ncbi:(Fe-S)-binding protein [Bacillus sp. Marseille-Q3570]|uniref:(Fe-S)-binding protein n=1 Tax=Bacillus sp. Marseille-Q3570 TaxID=2963522 RepID=UPI0021B79B04|nr:(Fe-S)-binding protein [Bacillus sp. Marseille-Q3570]
MKVSLFITCLADLFYPEVGMDTVELLEKSGCDVDFPERQTCCGQPAFNSGYHQEAKQSAKHMIRVFQNADYVVTPSGSCATMFKEYVHLFDDDLWASHASKLADKTFELAQFLIEVLDVEDVGAKLPAKATYHTSCHMTRLLGVSDAPGKLLSQVEGLEMLPLPNCHDCCGFGGTFSVKMPEISKEMVDDKVENIKKSGADILIGSDCGCLMNISGRLSREESPVKVLHIAQVLNGKSVDRGESDGH